MPLTIVYNPEIVKGEDENNLLKSLFFLIRKWHGYVYLKRNRVLSSASDSFGLLCHNLTTKHVNDISFL